MWEEIVNTIFKWQTLIGNLGGIFGLLIALVVAGSARCWEVRIAGRLILRDVLLIRVAYQTLVMYSEQQKVGREEFPIWLSMDSSARPDPLRCLRYFELSLASLMTVDDSLAAHLSLFHRFYQDMNFWLPASRTLPPSKR